MAKSGGIKQHQPPKDPHPGTIAHVQSTLRSHHMLRSRCSKTTWSATLCQCSNGWRISVMHSVVSSLRKILWSAYKRWCLLPNAFRVKRIMCRSVSSMDRVPRQRLMWMRRIRWRCKITRWVYNWIMVYIFQTYTQNYFGTATQYHKKSNHIGYRAWHGVRTIKLHLQYECDKRVAEICVRSDSES